MSLSYSFCYSMVANKPMVELKQYIIKFEHKAHTEPHKIDMWTVRIRAIRNVMRMRRDNMERNMRHGFDYERLKQDLDEQINKCNELLDKWGEL